MAIAVPKALIIDDDEVVLRSLAKHLRSEGLVVDVAASPEQALELLKNNHYQVVTTDIYHDNSPISGDEFILQNIEQLKKSDVMILTANRRTAIERLPELNNLNIPVFEKNSSDDQLRFVELIKQKLNLDRVDEEAGPELVHTDLKPDGSSVNVPIGFELIHTIDEDTGWIGQLSWSPDGKKLAAQTSQKGVLLWTRENNNAVIIDSHTKPTGGLAWSPDGNTLAYTSRSNVLLFDTVNMQGKGFIDDKDSDDQLSPGLAWSPDGNSLAIGNRGGKINIFSPEDRGLMKSLQGSKDWTFALAWSPDSSLLAGGGDDNTLRTWLFPSGVPRDLKLHSDQITCVSSCPTEDLVASGSADKSIRIWTRSTGEHVRKLEGHSQRITSVAFSHDGSLLASKSDDGTVKLWRSDTWASVATLDESATHPGGLYTPGIAFHPKELILATLSSENAKIRIWKLRANQLLKPDEESILAASVSDQPASTDSLGFEPYVKALTRFLTDERTQPPLTLSIEGEWGSGKSSFMLQLENALRRAYQQQKISKLLKLRWIVRMRKERIPTPLRHRWMWRSVWPLLALPREERHPTFASVRFNAWRHDKDSSLWASFALTLLHKLSGELPGPLRAWTHLKLSARRFKWIDGWPVLLRTMLISALLLTLSVTIFYLLYTGGVEKILGDAKEFKGGELLLTVIKGSGLVGSAIAFLYLLNTLKETIGDPFKSDLKKYLQTPSYDAQISFIEQFHDDFGKIIETFAGKNKVYVFIDDLDRSEVPKAADLMQAINLLISDSPRVFFIVGMDRDKVAAGLAVKYEKILPYLSAVSKDRKDAINGDKSPTQKNNDLDAENGLEFGYSFIEKFIQIPFRIPQPAELGLAKLLDTISPMLGDATVPLATTSSTSSETTVSPTSAPPPTQPTETGIPTNATAAPQQVSAPAVTTEQEERRELIRIAVTNDSMTVRKIVQMVAPVLDYNPRRIKQFINMFRLKALIATETGLFDAPTNARSHKGLTLPQLGKFVAMGLKWPRLLTDLDEDNALLRELVKWALGQPYDLKPSLVGWTHRSDLAELIKYGCMESQDPFDPAKPADPSRYSLANVDAQRLLRVTPPVRSTHASSPGIGQ